MRRRRRNEIKKKIAPLTQIKNWMKGPPNIRWTNNERGFAGSAHCDDCIGACCMFLIINQLQDDEKEMMIDHGTVDEEALFDHDFESMKPVPKEEVIDLIENVKYNAHNPVDVDKLMRTSHEELKGQVVPATACGCLDGAGNCSVYNHRPQTCQDFTMDGATCRSVFIKKGSKAAKEIETAFNSAAEAVDIYSRHVIGAKRSTITLYDFDGST